MYAFVTYDDDDWWWILRVLASAYNIDLQSDDFNDSRQRDGDQTPGTRSTMGLIQKKVTKTCGGFKMAL